MGDNSRMITAIYHFPGEILGMQQRHKRTVSDALSDEFKELVVVDRR